MRFPVSRRTILLSGLVAASLGPLSACGLRMDTEPEIPDLDPSDELRNRIARILEATAASAGDPETATADLEKFRAAIGPVWSPPTQLATQSPSAEPPRSYLEAAEVVSTTVFDDVTDLDSGLITVLVDVATGFALTAGAIRPGIAEAAQNLLRTSVSQKPTERAAAPDADVCAGILEQARAAAYGYERLAVEFGSDTPERKASLTRLETLGSLGGEMLEKLAAADTEPPPDSPSWKLDPVPADAGSARELALALEDRVAGAILPWLRTDPLAALRLWESARTRSVFGAAQALRFTYSDSAASAAAPTPSASAQK
ncbi:hypothetical protein [Brevibacterium sp.]|uniref:hypothetical protein n=1 Tax=Brevibacterium sp. TaxID=1701 RepID=UPI0028113A22|nr:hypothetical protein [Brevibacterium sp.]